MTTWSAKSLQWRRGGLVALLLLALWLANTSIINPAIVMKANSVYLCLISFKLQVQTLLISPAPAGSVYQSRSPVHSCIMHSLIHALSLSYGLQHYALIYRKKSFKLFTNAPYLLRIPNFHMPTKYALPIKSPLMFNVCCIPEDGRLWFIWVYVLYSNLTWKSPTGTCILW